MFFIRDTACHQRRLGSMEAADSSTGDGNEHHREIGFFSYLVPNPFHISGKSGLFT